ncbi:hypothetical protein MKJ01_18245 [Chryseobacterium sp. SSA4.19]|uniref:DUF6630 family protein n=1 Tax=Chryseobacterium sp. SSA4.19 TaxID=2919915 RepID=UPI001F4EABA5|nr:DUF6630 family protein [Chryseobacterium sp. SSA4.19]MCJ8155699.1 hypothetical protein [Chryseobacterium sp. SSA4.19]
MMEKYQKILEILVNDQEYVQYAYDRLVSVSENPKNYEDEFFRLPDKDSDLVWFQFIDDLIMNQYAFEADWKEDYSAVKIQIEKLLLKKGILNNLNHDEDLFDLEPKDYLPRINQLLSENHHLLVNLDLNSDSYVSTLINKSEVQILLSFDERIKLF